MQDAPDAPELLEAVGTYLFAELRPQVPPQERFKLLVAANVCAVVAREIRAGSAPDRSDLELFRRLLGEPIPADDAGPSAQVAEEARRAATELAKQLREGELDAELDRALAGLGEHVRRKLEIARPGYAD